MTEPGPDYAAGLVPISEELHRIANEPLATARDVAEVSARLALMAIALEARIDLLRDLSQTEARLRRLEALSRAWWLVGLLGGLGWTVALVLGLRG